LPWQGERCPVEENMITNLLMCSWSADVSNISLNLMWLCKCHRDAWGKRIGSDKH
jgi:hypothetical protein